MKSVKEVDFQFFGEIMGKTLSPTNSNLSNKGRDKVCCYLWLLLYRQQ
jgi:hypothetical protein